MRRTIETEIKITAILPAYNLENSIGDIVKRTQKFVNNVIVVSDGSSDNTQMAALNAGAKCPEYSRKRGKGNAIRRGITFSKQFESKYIVLMDADGQHLPEEIPSVLGPLLEDNADMVVGSRMKGTLRTSWINKVGNYALKTISFLVTRRWFTDTESGFRGFKTEKLYDLDLNSESYEIESELLLRSLHMGYRVQEIPITVPKAVPGVTFYDGIKMGIYKVKMAFSLAIGG